MLLLISDALRIFRVILPLVAVCSTVLYVAPIQFAICPFSDSYAPFVYIPFVLCSIYSFALWRVTLLFYVVVYSGILHLYI